MGYVAEIAKHRPFSLFVYAFYKGLFDPHFHSADLGATFYIPTVYVPLLLCTHFMIFVMLLRPASKSISAR